MDTKEITGRIVEVLTELDRQTTGDGDVDYKALYYRLFNGVTDTINKLIELQQDVEQIIIDG